MTAPTDILRHVTGARPLLESNRESNDRLRRLSDETVSASSTPE